jgi:hypothetical protein
MALAANGSTAKGSRLVWQERNIWCKCSWFVAWKPNKARQPHEVQSLSYSRRPHSSSCIFSSPVQDSRRARRKGTAGPEAEASADWARCAVRSASGKALLRKRASIWCAVLPVCPTTAECDEPNSHFLSLLHTPYVKFDEPEGMVYADKTSIAVALASCIPPKCYGNDLK